MKPSFICSLHVSSSSPDALCYPGLVDIVHRDRVGPLTNIFPIRSSGIRSLSVAIFFVDEHLPLRTFSRTIFIPYDILAYDLYPVRSFSFTNICHYEHYTVRALSPTIFRHTNFCLRAFGMRTLSIRSFVQTPFTSYTDPVKSSKYVFSLDIDIETMQYLCPDWK